MASASEDALERARSLVALGDDEKALELVETSLRLSRGADNPQAQVLKAWLTRFGKGSEADTAVRRVLAVRQGDFYGVLGMPRFAAPSRSEYLKLSLLLHPDKCGARNAGEAFQRVTEAYNALKDDEQRARYDEKLRRSAAAFRQQQPPQHSAAPHSSQQHQHHQQPYRRPAGGGAGAASWSSPLPRVGAASAATWAGRPTSSRRRRTRRRSSCAMRWRGCPSVTSSSPSSGSTSPSTRGPTG